MNDSKNDDLSRVLGLDYGSVRIGVALSDPLKIIAQGYTTIGNTPRFFEQLLHIIEEKNVTLIVVGLPLNLKGERGSKSVYFAMNGTVPFFYILHFSSNSVYFSYINVIFIT